MDKKRILVFDEKRIEKYRQLLEKNLGDADISFCRNAEDVRKSAPSAEVAFVPYTFPQVWFREFQKLKWVQVMAAGVERFVRNPVYFRNITVTRMVGVDGPYMAEYVLAYLLYFCQKIEFVSEAKKLRKWASFEPEYLREKTCGIMGLGAVGSMVAKQLKDVAMRVVSWDLTPKDEYSFVDKQFPLDQLREFLHESDFVVVALPLTASTENLVDKNIFSEMRRGSYLINICRGEVVNENDLVQALKSGWIRGAVLDVAKTEPIPQDSELWECPNLIITPHISGIGRPEDMSEFFKENYRRYLKKEALLGIVDFEKGF